MKRMWTFQEDIIVCNFYLRHLYSWRRAADQLIAELGTEHSKSSVLMRLSNFSYLYCGSGLSRTTAQQAEVLRICRQQIFGAINHDELQKYIAENYSKESDEDLANMPTFTDISRLGQHSFVIDRQKFRVGNSFVETLTKFINLRDLRESEVYKEIGMSRQTFSGIMCEKINPKKRTVLTLCIGLKLSYAESVELLLSGGYAFSKSDYTDLIVKYAIETGVYDINDIDETLEKNGERALFSIE